MAGSRGTSRDGGIDGFDTGGRCGLVRPQNNTSLMWRDNQSASVGIDVQAERVGDICQGKTLYLRGGPIIIYPIK